MKILLLISFMTVMTLVICISAEPINDWELKQ